MPYSKRTVVASARGLTLAASVAPERADAGRGADGDRRRARRARGAERPVRARGDAGGVGGHHAVVVGRVRGQPESVARTATGSVPAPASGRGVVSP